MVTHSVKNKTNRIGVVKLRVYLLLFAGERGGGLAPLRFQRRDFGLAPGHLSQWVKKRIV